MPRDRLLIESDLGYAEPASAAPLQVAHTERLLAARLGTDAEDVRVSAWRALAELVRRTETLRMWPFAFREQFRA